jgi:uncharacterized membrane protein
MVTCIIFCADCCSTICPDGPIVKLATYVVVPLKQDTAKPINNINIIAPIILTPIINPVCIFELFYILHNLEQPSPLLVFPSSHYSSTVWYLSPHTVSHDIVVKFQM